MPCTYDESPEEIRERQERHENDLMAQAIERAEKQIWAPLLCSASRALERLGYDFDENPQLSAWWDKHKKEDLQRSKAEERQAQKERLRHERLDSLLKKSFGDLGG